MYLFIHYIFKSSINSHDDLECSKFKYANVTRVRVEGKIFHFQPVPHNHIKSSNDFRRNVFGIYSAQLCFYDFCCCCCCCTTMSVSI